MTNLLDDVIMLVSYKFESPTGINLTAVPPDYVEIMPNSTNPMYLYITPSQTMENGTHTIKVWAESQEKIDGKNIMSEKYPIYVTVLNNPLFVNLTTTTTTSTTTSTTSTTLPEDIFERVSWKPEYWIILIIGLCFLMAMPFLSFRSSGK
jgi:hypothetical protein